MFFRNVRVYGLENSFRVSKFPMSANHLKCTEEYTPRIKSLANANGGSGHDNFLKGIVVQFDFTATNKIWVEAERYHFFDIVSSQSTMHKLKDMNLDECFIKYTDKRIVEIMKELQKEFNEVNSKDSTAEERKEAFYNLVYSCPSGLLITAGISTNYLQLKTMYHQRKGHYLDEWSVDFVKFVNSLPYSDLITGEPNRHLCDDFDGDFDADAQSKAFQEAIKGIKTYASNSNEKLNEAIIKKDPCEGCTCYQKIKGDMYARCINLLYSYNAAENYHYFDCEMKGTGVAIPDKDIVNDSLLIEPKAFNGEEF